MPITAYTEYDTGQHYVTAPPIQEDTPPPDRLTTRHKPLLWTAVAFAVAALFAGGVYGVVSGLTDAADWFKVTLAALFIATLSGVVGFTAVGLGVRAHGEQLRAVKCSIKRAIGKATAELAEQMETLQGDLAAQTRALGENRQRLTDLTDLATVVRRSERVYVEQLDQRCQEMGGMVREVIAAEVGKMREAVDGRVDGLEDRVELAEETARQAATAEAVIARAIATDAGQVRQLRPHNGSVPPPRR